jgi:hypothetical protein
MIWITLCKQCISGDIKCDEKCAAWMIRKFLIKQKALAIKHNLVSFTELAQIIIFQMATVQELAMELTALKSTMSNK